MFLVTNFLSPPQFLDETLVLHIVSLPLLSNDLTLCPLFSLSFPDFVRFRVLTAHPANTPELREDPRLELPPILQDLRGWGLADLVLLRPGDGPDGVLNVDVGVVPVPVQPAQRLSAGHLTDEVGALLVLDDADDAGASLGTGVERGAGEGSRLVSLGELSRDLLPVFSGLNRK